MSPTFREVKIDRRPTGSFFRENERRATFRPRPRPIDLNPIRKGGLNVLERIASATNRETIRTEIIRLRTRVLPILSLQEQKVFGFALTQVLRRPQLRKAIATELQSGKSFREAFSTSTFNFINFINTLPAQRREPLLPYARRLDYTRRVFNSYKF